MRVAARLQHEHPVSGESQVGGERTSARTGADDGALGVGRERGAVMPFRAA
ncbi:hypothetical protein ACWEJQ_06500 [Streptomyces albidoflavus]